MNITENQKKLFENKYALLKQKFKVHMNNMTNTEPYELIATSDGRFYDIEKGCDLTTRWNWTTSFVTGLAPLYYKTTPCEDYLTWAKQFQKYYHSKVFYSPLESMHDMGFLYILYSIAMYSVTNDENHRTDALKAADELCKRFSIKGRYIDAWSKMDDESEEGRAIVDCMMNISLLLWAWKQTGNIFYREVADAHADTTLRYFVRDDDTVAHSFVFDRDTGNMVKESNTCGYSDGSWWARGTAWAVYGFSLIGEYMNSDKYTSVAKRLGARYMSELEGKSKIPIWDFRLPQEMPAKKCSKTKAEWDETLNENVCYAVDTSAAAIMSCAFLRNGTDVEKQFAIETIEELCSNYIDEDVNVPGAMHHQNGNMTYTTFGDYFLAEALNAILYDEKSIW